MTKPICNSEDKVHWKVDPIIGTYSLHTIGWITSGIFAITASLISLFLVFRHATHYSVPEEQRHIIRILLLIPVYALVSWASYVWYWYAVYWEVARDCYEAFVIASFFALLCQYIAPTLHTQKQFFLHFRPPPWPWPVGDWMNFVFCHIFDPPRHGLTWFNIIWIGVYQYCFVEVATTITSMATQYTGFYCADSDKPYWAHIWMISLSSLGVTIAMYLLIAFYLGLRTELAAHKPFLKLLSIKLVVFFSFWQEILIDLLVTENVIKPSRKISYGDIYTGLNTFLICVEMTAFAIMHVFSFPWQEYTASSLAKRQGRLTALQTAVMKDKLPEPIKYGGAMYALRDALNPWDAVKGFCRGMKWLCCVRRRERKLKEEEERVEPKKTSGSPAIGGVGGEVRGGEDVERGYGNGGSSTREGERRLGSSRGGEGADGGVHAGQSANSSTREVAYVAEVNAMPVAQR